jgi:hypothetical protein
MDPITIITLAEGVIQGVAQAVAVWPSLVALVKSGADPTPEQQAQIDAAVDAAHEALQAA